ncbi:MAG: glucosaminidase domain-containing protein [Anaerovoracaceae bacterium]
MVKKSNKKLIIALTALIFLCLAVLASGLGAKYFYISVAEKDAATVAKVSKTAKPVDLPSALRMHTAKKVSKTQRLPNYSVGDISSLDLTEPSGITAAELKMVTSQGLVGLEQAFVDAEKAYGVNCVFLMSIASLESAKGTMMFRPNNMFGYGKSGFSSKSEGIRVVASGLSSRYLTPGGSLYCGQTIKDVNKRYATNPDWHVKVANYMQDYYSVITPAHNEALNNIDE